MFTVVFYCLTIDNSLYRTLATMGLCHIIINLSSAHCVNENLFFLYVINSASVILSKTNLHGVNYDNMTQIFCCEVNELNALK